MIIIYPDSILPLSLLHLLLFALCQVWKGHMEELCWLKNMSFFPAFSNIWPLNFPNSKTLRHCRTTKLVSTFTQTPSVEFDLKATGFTLRQIWVLFYDLFVGVRKVWSRDCIEKHSFLLFKSWSQEQSWKDLLREKKKGQLSTKRSILLFWFAFFLCEEIHFDCSTVPS